MFSTGMPGSAACPAVDAVVAVVVDVVVDVVVETTEPDEIDQARVATPMAFHATTTELSDDEVSHPQRGTASVF